ncbi:MAG TPA: hypothetical protein VHZ74_23940 [Bryobacteraceae bacterium]|jgi:hypothetical protein|nr:hypothetical protein [Bryobacteraceae bacterium]
MIFLAVMGGRDPVSLRRLLVHFRRYSMRIAWHDFLPGTLLKKCLQPKTAGETACPTHGNQ